MLPEKFNLEIVTPEELLFTGEVHAVIVPGVEGYLGILPGHAPLLTELQTGTIIHYHGSEEIHIFCSGGFLEVLEDQVSILVNEATLADHIDIEEAKKIQDQAEKALNSLKQEVDYIETMQIWRKALAQLETAEKTGRT